MTLHHGHGHGHGHSHANDSVCQDESEGFIRVDSSDMTDVERQIQPAPSHHDHGHGHHHDHKDMNVRAAFLHVVGDIIQSIGVLIASIVVWLKPEYVIVDPICTFLFSIIVMGSTFFLLREAVHVLMEGK